MKKIIISLSIIAVVAAVGVGVTTAYFTDTEISEDNTMAAGTMDLNIDGGNTAVKTMNLSNKAPGDSGVGTETLKNVGSLEGKLDIKMGTVTNYPCTDNTYGANDSTENCTSDAGALGMNAQMALYIDIDQSGDWNSNDIGLDAGGLIYKNTGPIALDYADIDDYSDDIWNDVYALLLMGLNIEDNFVIDWKIPTVTGNEVQGDALEFDVSFILRQADAPATN